MNAIQVVREMVASSGKSARTVSAGIGRTPNYLSSTLTQGFSGMKCTTLALIAKACGFTLLVRNDENGTEYVIDE